jgi:FkbM family methyltransferase
MNRTLIKILKPFASVLRKVLGPQQYRELRAKLIPSHRFDEVAIVWRAIGKARANSGIMFDVGCHRGESAEPFAEVGWTVHCFEPNPENWPIIESRVITRFPKTRLYCAAVGETSEKNQTFYTSPESSGISSLHSFHETHRPSFTVDVMTLSDHCVAEGIDRVDFLKIDTEGFDYFVLRGIDWERLHPDVIVCEFEDSKTEALGYNYSDMATYLVDHGYRVILSEWKPITRYGENHEWLRFADFPCTLNEPKGWGNLIAVLTSSAEELVLQQIETISPGSVGAARLL